MTEFEIHLLAELRAIRETLGLLVADLIEPETEGEPLWCQHPEEARIDFGTTLGQADWQCRQCGYRTVPQGQV